MSARVTIAIDAMSGDKGPEVVIPAALAFLGKNPSSSILLTGDEQRLRALLAQYTPAVSSLSIVHADSVVGMDERPSHALRNKQDSSMAVAMMLVAEGRADACVSAGNTGALMMLGRSILKMFPGIDRPAITKLFPSQGGGCFVLDLGANVDCTAEHLLQFALMGQSLAHAIKGVERPRVALLNVGGESIKGNEQVRLAATLFEQCEAINYVGFAEGGDIFRAVADVIVCDGFVGNVALKSAEGAAKIILNGVRNFFAESWYTRLLARLVTPLIAKGLRQLDPETHNGAMFLGLQGVLVKSHGAATVASFEHAIDLAAQEARVNLPGLIAARLDEMLV
jgi:glycerol-3-phosphate acyltransferase PlsX